MSHITINYQRSFVPSATTMRISAITHTVGLGDILSWTVVSPVVKKLISMLNFAD